MQGPDSALRVFISYARADGSALAEDLKTGLEVAGFAPFLDRHDIAAGEDWEARLGALIEAADTVVFLVSPAAVRSERCTWEVKTAEDLSKRVLPVLAVNVPEVDTPESLRRRNYVKFTDGRSFASGLRELSLALRENVAWIREHTRLGELAARWRQRERPDDLLLRGAELEAARAWLSQWASPAPEPTSLHREYIGASEAAEHDRNSAERQRLEAIASAQVDRARALSRSRKILLIAAGLLVLLFAVTVWGRLRVRELDKKVTEEQQRVAFSQHETESFRQRVVERDRDVTLEQAKVDAERIRVAQARRESEVFRSQALALQREVIRERENVGLERARVTEARRNVAEFNQSVERLRAQVDSALSRLEQSSDPEVARQMRAISEQIAAARSNIRLSEHFTLEDLTQSESAGRRGIENAPDPEGFERLRHTALLLDRVRDTLGGCPLTITSGYRGPTLNRLLGSAPQSVHSTGYAVDFTCGQFGTAYQVARAIERSPVMQDIDQLFVEMGRWVHLSADPKKRRQVMTTYRSAQGLGRAMRLIEVDTDGRLLSESSALPQGMPAPTTPAQASSPTSTAKSSSTIDGQVRFAAGGTTIESNDARVTLDKLVERLREIKLEALVVVGHADASENEAERLSQARAEAAKAYLVGRGIPTERIYTEGKGANQPVADNGTSEGRAMNRRVELEALTLSAQ